MSGDCLEFEVDSNMILMSTRAELLKYVNVA
jgi:hypothetical protein